MGGFFLYGRRSSVADQMTKAATAIFQQSPLFLRPGRPKGRMIWTTMASSKKSPIAFVIY